MTFAKEGAIPALKELLLTFIAAEQKIRAAVDLAVAQSPEYTLVSVLAILNGLFIMYYFINLFARFNKNTSGSQAWYGAQTIGFFIFVLLEFSALSLVGGFASFIPIWDGILNLAINIKPVMLNINWVPFAWWPW